MDQTEITAAEYAGLRRCLKGTGPEDCCGEPAVIHVMRNDGMATMSCVGHSTAWGFRPHADSHPIGGACGLPGTNWRFSTPTGQGCCVVPGLDDVDPGRWAA